MSQMAPEAGASGGGLMGGRILGIPTLVWVAGAALVSYFLFFRGKSTAGAGGTSTGGGGTSTTGNISVQPQPVSITVTGEPQPSPEPVPSSPSPNPQPKPPPVPKTIHTTPPIFNGRYIVKAGESLGTIASRLGISRVELAHANGLGTGAGLRAGQVIKVPKPPPKGVPGPPQ